MVFANKSQFWESLETCCDGNTTLYYIEFSTLKLKIRARRVLSVRGNRKNLKYNDNECKLYYANANLRLQTHSKRRSVLTPMSTNWIIFKYIIFIVIIETTFVWISYWYDSESLSFWHWSLFTLY